MDQITLIRRINHFIKRRATGTPDEFAQKLGISKSGLHYTLKKLKEDFEAPIEYNKKDGYYHYAKEGELEIGFKPLSHAQLQEINASGINFLGIFYNPRFLECSSEPL